MDAQRNPLPLPAKRSTTTVAYVDGSLAHPDRNIRFLSILAKVQLEACTIMDSPNRSISHIMALPLQYGGETADSWYCPPKMLRDASLPDELHMV